MNKYLNATTSQGVLLEEPVIFERSRDGISATSLPVLDVPAVSASKLFGNHTRTNLAKLPNISEPEVVRHFTRLSTWNYSVDLGIYPLGSCTMKYNPKLNEDLARSSTVSNLHPYDPEEWSQGHLRIMYELEQDLKELTGLPGITLQPCAGAHGEFAAMAMVAAYDRSKGKVRKTILTPDTSHGTNPASAALAGFKIVQLATSEDGYLHPETVKKALTPDVAGLMLTNPNTIGFFEKYVKEIADMLHEQDAFLYIDGANMNAIMGLVRPGDFGADVMHLNLHKTFSTPHGGGGPGSGPVVVCEKLKPFLPTPHIEKNGDVYKLNYNNPHSIGRVKAFYGNYSVLVKAWAYIKALGADGLRAVSENAILNANYIRVKLQDIMHIPFQGANMHEIVFNDKNQKDKGLDTTKIAKRLIEYGMHPPTVHFPLCVKNALMIEPTETEDKTELDRFVIAMREIVEVGDSYVAPVRVFREKVDEAKAGRELKLKYKF